MRGHRLTIFLLSLVFMTMAIPEPVVAAPRQPLRRDSSVLEVRVFPKGRVEAYQDQREFNYKVQAPRQLSLWDRMKKWLLDQIDQLFSNRAVSVGFNWLIVFLSIAIVGYAIVRLVGTDKVMLFMAGRKRLPPAFTTGEDDIHAMDLDAGIAEAEAKQEYRRAIRLQYLRSLKMLSDRSRIEWATSKTNIDYLAELRGGTLAEGFQRITRLFEYAWYGEMEIGQGQYDRAADWFTDFNKTIAA